MTNYTPEPEYQVGQRVEEYVFRPEGEIEAIRWNEEYDCWEYYAAWSNDHGGQYVYDWVCENQIVGVVE